MEGERRARERERGPRGTGNRGTGHGRPPRWVDALVAATLVAVAALMFPLTAGGANAVSVGGTTMTVPTCTPAGATGLTAAVVAIPHERISGTINASGCDIGVYVGPGAIDVSIVWATIANANDHGIFVQDVAGTMIADDVVAHNGLASHKCSGTVSPPCIAEDKAIELSGTSHATVRANLVIDNVVDGGIGISDDGAIDPGAPAPGTSHVSTANLVAYNSVVDNAFGCGIVVASYDATAGVYKNSVVGNSVVGSAPGTGPFVGGIVVAADAPGTSVWDNLVKQNQVVDSVIPGIVVHSNAPGDRVWGTMLVGNLLVQNGFQSPPNDPTLPTAIEVVAEDHPGEPNAPKLWNTAVLDNSANQDAIGVWLCDASLTTIVGLHGNAATPVATC